MSNFCLFFVPVFILDNFLEIKLSSIACYYQSRINISMYLSTENNKVLQLKREAAIERQYNVFCSNNIQRLRIFFSNLKNWGEREGGEVSGCTETMLF